MNRKLIIAIISAAVLLLVGLVIIWLIVSRAPADDTTTDTTNTNQVTTITDTTTTTTTTTDPTTTDTTQATVVVVQQDDQQAITSSSRSFTERFGSYSSDTNFENIELSRYLMTDAMSQQADKLISQGQNTGQPTGTFLSIDSTVTGVTLTDYSDGATGATVEVAVRQKKTVGQQAATYSNETARLTLKKVGGSWKVDSFRWL